MIYSMFSAVVDFVHICTLLGNGLTVEGNASPVAP